MLDSTITINQNSSKPENLCMVTCEGVVIDSICSQAFLFGDSDIGKSKFKRREVLGICKYCGNKAIYQFKNGKYCCKINVSQCPVVRKINSKKNLANFSKNKYAEKKAKSVPLCNCGCGEKTKWSKDKVKYNKYINGHWIRKNNPKRGKSKYANKKAKGAPLCKCGLCNKRTKWNPCIGEYDNYIKYHHLKGIKRTKEFCNNQSKRMKKNNPMKNPEIAKKQSKSLKALGDSHPSKKPEHRKRVSKRMLNGGATYALSFIKNPSKPQVELFNLVKLLYPNSILNHPSLNFSIDIAIPEKNIAIEYDEPYWHDFKKDKIRQNKLENIGWKFLRYVSYVPTINILKNDLINIINH